jgi:hypothetical protein
LVTAISPETANGLNLAQEFLVHKVHSDRAMRRTDGQLALGV